MSVLRGDVCLDRFERSVIAPMLHNVNSNINSVKGIDAIYLSQQYKLWLEAEQQYLAAVIRATRRVRATGILITPSEKDEQHIAWIGTFPNQNTLL